MIWIYITIFALLKVWKEYMFLEKNDVGHAQNLMIVIWVSLGVVLIDLNITCWKEACWIISSLVAPYWLTYDIVLNIVRGKKWYYLGTKSWFDRLGVYNWYLKIILLFLTISVIIEFYK